MRLHSIGKILTMPTNIRFGWKRMEVGNTLAYYTTATITAVKSFILQAPDKAVESKLHMHFFHSVLIP